MFGKKKSPPIMESEHDILVALAQDYMHDKKIRRRWKTFFIILAIIYIVVGISVGYKAGIGKVSHSKPHTALVQLHGAIGMQGGVYADTINESLRAAFESKVSKAVILSINSPGGSPVQSAYMNDEIVRLRDLYPDKPLYVVVSDVCASGGYFVAAAADKIFANRSSIVGSIGVRMDGFGFVDTIKKLGIERRSLTAGENKAFLDPFLPMNDKHLEHSQQMLKQVHQHFIEVVKKGRAGKLADNPDLFSGLFWSGEEAKELGLIDGFYDVDSVARDLVGEKEVINYTVQPDVFEQLFQQIGVSIGSGLAQVFTARYQLQ